MPTASNHSATSRDSAAEPETKNRIRPPSRSRIVLNTSLSAIASCSASSRHGCLRCCRTRERLDADADRPVEDLRLQPAVRPAR